MNVLRRVKGQITTFKLLLNGIKVDASHEMSVIVEADILHTAQQFDKQALNCDVAYALPFSSYCIALYT